VPFAGLKRGGEKMGRLGIKVKRGRGSTNVFQKLGKINRMGPHKRVNGKTCKSRGLIPVKKGKRRGGKGAPSENWGLEHQRLKRGENTPWIARAQKSGGGTK